MDAVLLCMKKRGIRFFRKIQFPNTDVIRFHKKDNFLGLLRSRKDAYDNVLVMAHGGTSSILTTTHDISHPFEIYISLSETKAFSNNFIFAVSCLTANEFGKQCISDGAIAYLGYQVEIGALFASHSLQKSNIPKKVSTAIDTIIKRIFLDELSKSFERFLKEPISVQLLKEIFSFSLEKRISQLTEMTPDRIYEVYGIKINEHDRQKYFLTLVLNELSFLDDVSKRLVCIGDENYISASFLNHINTDGRSAPFSLTDLESNSFFKSMHHEGYKEYLRALVTN